MSSQSSVVALISHPIIRVVMITIIGTGHVFNLAEPVSFIVKNTWPDAVLIELDKARYESMMNDYNGVKPQGEQNMSTIYANTAKYQQKMSE